MGVAWAKGERVNRKRQKYEGLPGFETHRNGRTSLAVRSQEEVGRALGISAMRVSQIERLALAKLRRHFLKGFNR